MHEGFYFRWGGQGGLLWGGLEQRSEWGGRQGELSVWGTSVQGGGNSKNTGSEMGLTWCHEERARDPLCVESGEQWAEKQGQSDRGWITQDFGGHREELQVSHIAKHFKCLSSSLCESPSLPLTYQTQCCTF